MFLTAVSWAGDYRCSFTVKKVSEVSVELKQEQVLEKAKRHLEVDLGGYHFALGLIGVDWNGPVMEPWQMSQRISASNGSEAYTVFKIGQMTYYLSLKAGDEVADVLCWD